MGLTEELCRTIVALDDVKDPIAIAAATRTMIDGFAVALAGSVEEPPHLLADHIRDMGGTPLASVIGLGFKTSPYYAAYLNGVLMHVLDFEPMWYPPTHTTSTTLPAVTAIGERIGASGHDVLVAFLKGCEIQGRILFAARTYALHDLSFHPPGLAGVMASAVGVAHLLHLDETQLRNALGIAASRAGSLIANVGTMTKSTHCGLAGALGLEAALLAQRGFTGNTDILENGYFKTFFKNEVDEAALLAYGRPFRLVDPGVAIKMFPSQYGTHFCITAGLELHERIDAPTIDDVEMRVPLMPYVNRPSPKTGLDGKFSMQYTLAAALLDGVVTIGTFSDERRFRSDMVELLSKVRLIPDDTIPAQFADMHVEVRVVQRDGTSVQTRCDGPKGLWNHAPITPQDHARKIADCLAVVLEPDAAAALARKLQQIDTLNAAALQDCLEVLRTPAAAESAG